MESVMILTTVQAVFGAIDLALHHEVTERLTWRKTAVAELRLHAARNLLYTIVFLVIGWAEPHGLLAFAFMGVLAVEITITLVDFVIEDRTRLLPESERVLHTVLTVSFGALLVLLAPHLIAWAGEPTGLVLVDRGAWSIVMSVFAASVGLWGLRDCARSFALGHETNPADVLVTPYLSSPSNCLITGGTGFIGTRLCEALVAAGHQVTVLTRDPRKARDLPLPIRIVKDLDSLADSETFDVVVNLAGAPVAAGRWTAKRKAYLTASRVETTKKLVGFIGRLKAKPEVLISASAIGYYGADSDDPITESTSPTPGFSHDMCAACEAAARTACRYGVRVVTLRLGLVLAAHGGPLGMMMPPFEFGLGARLGSGRQWMAWVHLDDVIAMIAFLIAGTDLRGPFNAVAPNPVRNADFSTQLARTLRRPCLLAIPSAAIHMSLGEMGFELLLASKRVVPKRLADAGFTFRFPELGGALKAALRPRDQESPLPNRAA